MPAEPTTFEDWKPTLLATLGLVILSTMAWYLLSHLSEAAAGTKIGSATTIGLAVLLVWQTWYYMTRVRNPKRQLLLMGVSFIQVVPFLFAAVYGSYGYHDLCVEGARRPSDVLYFSYVTFTTVGFGDLRPIGVCRALAVAEAITGYILLGLFVAAAVGLYGRAHRSGRNP